jgi:3-isopropylmalate dehydratase small subunit
MQKVVRIDGHAAPLPTPNIDTDQIIPAQYLKTVTRDGLGKGLFHDLRYLDDGCPNSEFVLNQPSYSDASILIAGDNFGCGSSREHAPWALMDFGFHCVIAPSFGDIFANNSANNGLLLVTLPAGDVKALLTEARGANHVFTVDLEAQSVTAPSGRTIRFDIESDRKTKLLQGLDAIGETLAHSGDIRSFEQRIVMRTPWLAQDALA